jgi:2-polyprenyl-6-hydroxyphenyl methylase/3-demethylubiquinone-9 3-methyltransferase
VTEYSANVDQDEIDKFERMAARWWDLEGDFKPIHMMNPTRTNYIDSIAPVAEQRVLDVGCGGGILSEALAQRGAVVTGIDMGEAPLETAKLHALESGLNIHYQRSSAEDFAETQAEQFDTVCCMELLEHVPSPGSLVSACAKLAKPGAHLFFSTINRNPKAYAFTILGAEYLLKMLPKGTHEYKKFIQPAELGAWVREAGLVVDDVCGIAINPFTQTFSLAPHDVSVNYVLCAKKPD